MDRRDSVGDALEASGVLADFFVSLLLACKNDLRSRMGMEGAKSLLLTTSFSSSTKMVEAAVDSSSWSLTIDGKDRRGICGDCMRELPATLLLRETAISFMGGLSIGKLESFHLPAG
jgi:hypothetical protein